MISPAPAGISTKNIGHISRKKQKKIFLQSRNRINNLLEIVRRVQAGLLSLNCSKRADKIKTNVHNSYL